MNNGIIRELSASELDMVSGGLFGLNIFNGNSVTLLNGVELFNGLDVFNGNDFISDILQNVEASLFDLF